MKKFSKLAGATATVMAAAMVLSSTAMADETFKIGGIGPITGAAAVYGQAVMNASQMAAIRSSSISRMTSMMQKNP